jgi:hypothetical protein
VLDLDHVFGLDRIRRGDFDVNLISGRDRTGIGSGFSRATTTPNAACLRCGSSWRCRGSGRCGGRGAPSTARGWRGLLFRTNALLALPASADARDLVVAEKREMAAHGNVHLTKQIDHFVAGDPELAGHVVYAKLAQTILLAGSNRTRSMPLFRGGLDERTNASREL